MIKTYLMNKSIASKEWMKDLHQFIVDESKNSYYLEDNETTRPRHNENFVRYLLTKEEMMEKGIDEDDCVRTAKGLYAVSPIIIEMELMIMRMAGKG